MKKCFSIWKVGFYFFRFQYLHGQHPSKQIGRSMYLKSSVFSSFLINLTTDPSAVSFVFCCNACSNQRRRQRSPQSAAESCFSPSDEHVSSSRRAIDFPRSVADRPFTLTRISPYERAVYRTKCKGARVCFVVRNFPQTRKKADGAPLHRFCFIKDAVVMTTSASRHVEEMIKKLRNLSCTLACTVNGAVRCGEVRWGAFCFYGVVNVFTAK